MKIGVIGAGRLGICFALLAESAGHDVYVSDISASYVNKLTTKTLYSNEPEVEDLLLRSSKLRATTNNGNVIKSCDVIFTFVPTPSLDDGSYDCSLVDAVVCDIIRSPNLEGKKFIVGCTTNPGFVDKVDKKLEGRGISVFYSPEFVAQGTIIRDMKNADMILCGGRDEEGFELIKSIYLSFMDGQVNFYPMSNTAAEITKIGINCFLTYKISYANMMGQILYNSGCGGEIKNILASIGADSRIGSKYLNYGLGFGGPCLPRDNRALGYYADQVGLKYSLPQVTDDFNEAHPIL
jgi:nucleotide sugar dehydrogenase